jgi:hypothetical protein
LPALAEEPVEVDAVAAEPLPIEPTEHSGFVADLEAWKKMVILCSPLLAEED